MKKYAFIISFFWSCFFLSQESLYDTIKLYTLKSVNADNNYRKREALEFAEKALKASIKKLDNKMIVQSYIFKADLYARYGYHKESFECINKTLTYDYYNENKYSQARIKLIKSINYSKLGLDSLYLKENKEILSLLNPNSEINNEIKILLRAISRIEDYYEKHQNKKVSESYFKMYENIIKRKKPDVFVAEYSNYLGNKGQRLLEKKIYDSALFYFRKDLDFVTKKGETAPYYQMKNLGDYHYTIKDHRKALEHYEKAIKMMENAEDKNSEYSDVYKRVSELYGIIGKKDKEVAYLKKYTSFLDTIAKERKPALENAILEIVKQKEFEHQNTKNKIWIYLALFIFILTGLFLYLKNLHQNKNKLQEEFDFQISEKENMLQEIRIKSKENQEKIKISINDLVEMAKQNDLAFLVNFENTFSEFRKKITDISPEINNSELEILAFTYLGFSSKEIARYTHKSLRTIQNKKYIIRKKLNIEGHIFLNIWVKEVILNS